MLYDLSKLDNGLRKQCEASPLFRSFPKQLLSIDGDHKTPKGRKLGFLTGIQYLSPYRISGVNVCAMAHIAECHEPCLYTAGHGVYPHIQLARLRKTLFKLQYSHEYKNLVFKEIERLRRKAEKLGLVPLVRLNGTSDLDFRDIIASFPDIQFYDYSKIAKRFAPDWTLPNYDLTFSYSGVKAFRPQVDKAIGYGARIAVVFRSADLVQWYINSPRTINGVSLTVIDGDDSDVRHIEPKNCVVGLYAKGKGRYDQSGFVVG